jgi:hypothetical protein
MDKQLLESLVATHLSVSQIAKQLGCSKTTVKNWLKKHDLRTKLKPQYKQVSKESLLECIELGYGENMTCSRLQITAGTYRYWMKTYQLKSPNKSFSNALWFEKMPHCELCGKKCHKRKICGQCVARATRQGIKNALVYLKGGKCERCGYDKIPAALDFHHSDPNQKELLLRPIRKKPSLLLPKKSKNANYSVLAAIGRNMTSVTLHTPTMRASPRM